MNSDVRALSTRARQTGGQRLLSLLASVTAAISVAAGLGLAPWSASVAQAAPPVASWGPNDGAELAQISDAASPLVMFSDDGTKAIAAWFVDDGASHDIYAVAGSVAYGNILWGSPSSIAAVSSGVTITALQGTIKADGTEASLVWNERDNSSFTGGLVYAHVTASFPGKTVTFGTPGVFDKSTQANYPVASNSPDLYTIATGYNGSEAWTTVVWESETAGLTLSLVAQAVQVVGGVPEFGVGSVVDTYGTVGAQRPGLDVSDDGTKVAVSYPHMTGGGSNRQVVYGLTGSLVDQGAGLGPNFTWATAPGTALSTNTVFNSEAGSDVVLADDGSLAVFVYADDNAGVRSRGALLDWSTAAGSFSALGGESVSLGALSSQTAISLEGSNDATKVVAGWNDGSGNGLTTAVAAVNLASPPSLAWSSAVSHGGDAGTDDPPFVAVSSDGAQAVAGWREQGSSGYSVRASIANLSYAATPDQEWSVATSLSAEAWTMEYPRVAVPRGGGAAATTLGTAIWVDTALGSIRTSSTPYTPPPNAPGTPVAQGGNAQATITFTPPSGGTTPVSYAATSSPGSFTCTVLASASPLACDVTGLSNGTSYSFTTTATGVSGVPSASSGASNSVTPAQGPTISSQPQDDTQNAGQTATFSVSATGSGSLSYQWQVQPSGGGWSNVSTGSGGTTSSYTTAALSSGDDASNYRVQVTDSNGTTTSNAALLTVISPPGAPNQPTATAGNGSATVTVSAGSGGTPTSYTVTASPTPSSGSPTCTVSGASGNCSFNNLTNGTAYTFSATATNAAGTSVSSSASAAVTPLAPPGTPGTPTAVVASSTSATVSVVAPSSGGAPATYTVTASPGGANCTVTVPATSCTVTGLTPSSSYTFTATATNVGGTSSASASSSSTQIAAPGTPGTPSAVAGPASATVTIAAPSSGGPPTTYLVTASGGGGQTCTVTSPATSCVVSGLTPSTSYTFTATATNGVGTSASSLASNAVTPTTNVPPGTPGQPTAVASNGGATVTVSAPGSGGTPTSYTVTASPTPSSGSPTCTVSGASGSCSFNNLTNGTAYSFTSTATNGAGTSGSSVASAPVTPLAPPGTPGQASAVVAGSTSATVTIAPPSTGGAPASYLVTASGGGGQTCTVTVPATSCTVTGLTSGQSYTFTSTATNVGGTSSASMASASITLGAPGVPGAPTAVAGAGSVTVTIAAPSSGGSVTSYTVTSSPAGGSCTVTVPATSCAVTGLTSGTSYTFTSTATNGAGTSASSVASNAVTPTSPTPPTPTRPSAPGSVTVTAGNGSALVSWTAPVSAGSSPITNYRVVASPGGAQCVVLATVMTCTLSGLTNGTPYTVSVSAQSAVGIGAAATSSPFTPGSQAPATPSVLGVLAGNGSATVTVAAGSGGGTVTSYVVTASPGGATCTVTAPARSCAVSGLTNGTSYTFTATATGPGGTSAASPASSAVTPVAPITPTPAPLPTPLNPGQSNLQQGGQTNVPVIVVPNPASNGLAVAGTGFTMDLSGLNGAGNRLPLGPDGVLDLLPDRRLRASGTGFFPNTDVDIYLDPPTIVTSNGTPRRRAATAEFLGRIRTDALGEFDGTVTLSADVPVGEHVVQAVGVTEGNTERAMSIGVRVQEEVANKPGPVRDLAVTKKTKSSVSLAWTAPLDDGGSAIIKYKVRYRLRGETDYRSAGSVEGLMATVKGLSPNTLYYFRIRAVNDIGTGPSGSYAKTKTKK